MKYPDTSGKAAIDGTHSHTLLEKCLTLNVDADTFIDRTLSDTQGEFKVTSDRVERVQLALDYIYNVLKGGAKIHIETRFNPDSLVRRTDMSGTLDVVIIGDDWIQIIDYKDGMTPVSAEHNPQLEQYAVGVLAQLNSSFIRTVELTIIQPKLRIKGVDPISSWVITKDYILRDVVPQLIIEGDKTDDVDAPLVPGESQCKNCKANGACSTFAQYTMRKSGVVFKATSFESLGIPDEIYTTAAKNLSDSIDKKTSESIRHSSVAQQSADKDPVNMSNEQLQELVEGAPLMRELLDSAEKEALRRALEGQKFPGLKVVNGPGSRAWVHDEDEMKKKLIGMGIPRTAVYVTKFVSPAQAEKLQWQKRDGSKVTLSDKQLKRMETEYVKKSKGRPTLVPESDPRQAIAVGASNLFSCVQPDLPSWLMPPTK